MTEIQITLSPEQSADNDFIKNQIAKNLNIDTKDISSFRITRKSIDARRRYPLVIMKIAVFVNEEQDYIYENHFDYKNVSGKKEVIIIGAGPAGLFSALRLIEGGLCPIIFERGKTVNQRRDDIANINSNKDFNTESNFCFGEGGAGTFSDGKLYSRSNKRGNIRRIIEIFHKHGAQDEILYDSHPHIGTNILSKVVTKMRETIINCGGQVNFNSKVTDIILDGDKVCGVKLSNGTIYKTDKVILATGHSARDIYQLLYEKKIDIQSKGFAIGVRVEHPQELIDSIQYKGYKNNYLPAASYNLTSQSKGRGVYSFCMCPGGVMVPSATEANQIVVNGMSGSARNTKFANSGIVVELHPEDFTDFHQYNELCGIYYQQYIENLAFVNNGGKNQVAPAQRLDDFVKNKLSTDLPQSSYLPGLISSPLHFWLPNLIKERLQDGFKNFNKKMKGFITSQAIIVGVESRTSSPIRIPRDRETLEHTTIKGLYPCGEGAGYSGGITSSAMDGENVASQIINRYK